MTENSQAPGRIIRRVAGTDKPIRFSHHAGAWLVYSIVGLFRLLGVRGASDFGAWLLKRLGPFTKNHKIGLKNLARAFPDKTETERLEILMGVWETLGRTAGEYAHLRKFLRGTGGTKLEISGFENLEQALEGGKGAIMLTGHFANWETQLVGAGLMKVEGNAIYRPLNNPLLDKWLLGEREAVTSLKLIGKQTQGARAFIAPLRKNKVLCFLADQKLKEGRRVSLFGQDAMTTEAPGWLSVKFKAPIVPVWAERIAPLHYRIHVEPPLSLADTGDVEADVQYALEECNRFYEKVLSRNPAQWLWLHDRWGGVPRQ